MRCRKTYANDEAYREAKKRQSKRYRLRNGSGRHFGHWTEEELMAVMKHEQPDSELARRIPHSVAAIQAARRRVRLGELSLPGYDPSVDALAGLTKLYDDKKEE